MPASTDCPVQIGVQT